MEGKEEGEEKKLMQHPINRPILPVLSDEIFTDREDLLALLKFRAMNTRFQRTMSFALLGHRRVGKTEVLKRLYNDLFWDQKFERAAKVASKTWKSPQVTPWYISKSGFTAAAEKYLQENGFLYSTWEQVNRLLQLFGLRTLAAE